MGVEHPGVAAVEAAIDGDSYIRSAGQISDAAALLRGLERYDKFDVDNDADWGRWAAENSPMTSFSLYGFDAGGNWSCVFINEYSGTEPPTIRPWRHAIEGDPDPAEIPHDPDQLLREYVQGYHVVEDDYVDDRAVDALDLQASNVPWSSDSVAKQGAVSEEEAKTYLEARFGD